MKYILLAIAHQHDARTSQCTPTLKDLCIDTGMSVSTVRRNIEGLVQLNLLSIAKKEGFGQRYSYTLLGFNPYESKRVNKPSEKTKAKREAEPETPETAGELWNRMFDKIWEVYPRKVSKANAQRAFSKIAPVQSTYVAIVQNVQDRMLGEWSDSEPRFIPHLATYLNGERWKDEVEKVTPKLNLEGDNEYLKGI